MRKQLIQRARHSAEAGAHGGRLGTRFRWCVLGSAPTARGRPRPAAAQAGAGCLGEGGGVAAPRSGGFGVDFGQS
jgi:hypothetical protein